MSSDKHRNLLPNTQFAEYQQSLKTKILQIPSLCKMGKNNIAGLQAFHDVLISFDP